MRANLRILVLAAALAVGGLVKAQEGAQQQPDTGTGVISGVVTDGLTGRPLAGAVVYVGITGRGAVGRVSRQLTDRKGRFVFTDLPAHDQYFLNASGFGYVNGRDSMHPPGETSKASSSRSPTRRRGSPAR
jgi:hypothetical protein